MIVQKERMTPLFSRKKAACECARHDEWKVGSRRTFILIIDKDRMSPPHLVRLFPLSFITGFGGLDQPGLFERLHIYVF